MRLFVGIPVPPNPAFAQVSAELEKFRGVRLVPPGSWHITLRFLGEVDDASAVGDALATALRRRRALSAVVEGVGTFPPGFPPHAKAKVAWAGVRAEGLEALAKLVDDATATFGEPVDQRKFVGHVTLARFAKGVDLRSMVSRHAGTLFGQGMLDHVILFSSQFDDGRTTYAAVREFPLTG